MTETDGRLGRGRPRRADVDPRIREAAAALLRERGPAAVHVGAVATRSGVARTTIYRRYRDRRALLEATLAGLVDPGPPPDDVDVADKVRWVLDRVRHVVEEALGRGGLAAVLADADPDYTEALRAALASGLQPVLRAMVADAKAGLLHPDVDPETVVDLALGGYLGHAVRHGRVPPGWTEDAAALLLRAVAPGPAGTSAEG